MRLGSLLALAAALSVDAMAVGAARALSGPRVGQGEILAASLAFGGAQGLMPLLGWALAERLGPVFDGMGLALAATVLVALGLKMIWEARKAALAGEAPSAPKRLWGAELLVLAVATSTDAFAAGITLPQFGVPPAAAAAVVALVTGVDTAGAMLLARRLRRAFGGRIQLAGGALLIVVALDMLLGSGGS